MFQRSIIHARKYLFLFCLAHAFVFISVAFAQDEAAQRWLDRFSFKQPPVSEEGICAGEVGKLPSFTVTPAKTGEQLVRVSLAFAPAAVPKGMALTAMGGKTSVLCDVRALTHHPGQPQSIRRALVTFVYDFESLETVSFTLTLVHGFTQQWTITETAPNVAIRFADHSLVINADSIQCTSNSASWEARVIAPALAPNCAPKLEVIESGMRYLWIRLLCPDPEWPRIIELRADTLGTVTLRTHVQRLGKGDAYAPDLGWTVAGAEFPHSPNSPSRLERRQHSPAVIARCRSMYPMHLCSRVARSNARMQTAHRP